MRLIHGNIKNKPLRLVYVNINGCFYLVNKSIDEFITLDKLMYNKDILITNNMKFARWCTRKECIELERKKDTIYIDIYKRQRV